MISEVDLAPAAKRAMEKAEYERRRQEEEEIKRAMEEQALQDQANGGGNEFQDEKVKAIPIEELIKKGVTKKMKQISTTMSRTMQAENYSQAPINMQTVMDTNVQTQLNYRQRGDTMMTTSQRPPMQ